MPAACAVPWPGLGGRAGRQRKSHRTKVALLLSLGLPGSAVCPPHLFTVTLLPQAAACGGSNAIQMSQVVPLLVHFILSQV